MADQARDSSERDGADAFDALADPQRRNILSLLGGTAHSVQELADVLPISRPAVSRHLRVLSEAGLVREKRVGTRHIFSLQDEGLQAVRAYLERVWGETATRFELFAENTAPENTAPENTAPPAKTDDA